MADSFIVIARNSDQESWAYGPFDGMDEANEFVDELAPKYPLIDYQVSLLHLPENIQ